jgi:TPR repeat protein
MSITSGVIYNNNNLGLNNPEERVSLGIKNFEAKQYKQAVQSFNEAKAHSVAQYYLGLCHLNGYGVEQNESKAFSWFSTSKQLGNMASTYQLGLCYLNGLGVEQNRELALDNFLTVTKREEKTAPINEAQYMIAYCLQKAPKVDQKRMAECLLNAANQGSADALFFVGKCYFNGIGFEKNITIAEEHIKKAASQNSFNALLWRAYKNQKSLAMSQEKVINIFLNKNHKEKEALGWSYEELMKGFTKETEAFENYEKLARKDSEACFRLGICCLLGIGVEKSSSNAFEYFRKARFKNSGAQFYLALCYANGWGTEINEIQAKKYLDFSNLPGAKFYLGLCCLDRHLYNLKQEDAISYYQKSADKNFCLAQHNLGVCYQYGIGVVKNETTAENFFKAAQEKCPESKEALEAIENERKKISFPEGGIPSPSINSPNNTFSPTFLKIPTNNSLNNENAPLIVKEKKKGKCCSIQ